MAESSSRLDLPHDVVHGLQQRDPQAYDAVLHTLGPMLVSLAAGIVGSFDAGEDVVQNVLFRVWKLGPQFTPNVSVVAYFITSVRNAAISVARHERTESTYRHRVSRDASIAPSVATPEQDYDRQIIVDLVRRIVATLPERQRTAFELRYGHGMSVAEVAEILGITVGSTGNLLTRATRLVRERVLKAAERRSTVSPPQDE